MSSVRTIFALFSIVTPATAAVVFDGSPGTEPPPATLGPYTMTAFPDDPRPIFEDVSDVPSPLGGSVLFDIPRNHRRIGAGWATWSHDYTGDVYVAYGHLAGTMTLPPETRAFYFYVEPGPFQWYTYTATTDDGTSSGPVDIHGSHGATYFGFYATGDSTIASITVEGEYNFAWGEFGIAIPEPSTATMLALVALPIIRRRR